MQRRRSKRISVGDAPRSGLTILEVILSIGIFLASATVVSQLLTTGTRAAVEGRHQSQMAMLAQSKMDEVVAGIQEMSAGDNQGFEGDVDPGYTWGLTVEEGGQGDLLSVTITVTHENSDRVEDATLSLTRLMRDPQIYIDAAAAAEVAEEEAAEEAAAEEQAAMEQEGAGE